MPKFFGVTKMLKWKFLNKKVCPSSLVEMDYNSTSFDIVTNKVVSYVNGLVVCDHKVCWPWYNSCCLHTYGLSRAVKCIVEFFKVIYSIWVVERATCCLLLLTVGSKNSMVPFSHSLLSHIFYQVVESCIWYSNTILWVTRISLYRLDWIRGQIRKICWKSIVGLTHAFWAFFHVLLIRGNAF